MSVPGLKLRRGEVDADQATAPIVEPALRVVAKRRLGRYVAAVVVLVAVGLVIGSMARNQRFQWNVVGDFFTTTAVLKGLFLTIWLTAVVMVLGYAVGIVLAAMRLSTNPVLRTASWVYTWLFRSIPLLVQLIFWYNIGALYPRFSVGIPLVSTFASFKTVNLISAVTAAVIGLTLHEAAYASEIIRGGIISVEPTQTEAAQALGLSRARTFRRIVLPQAMRFIVPATANAVINTLKSTAVVSVVAVQDLLYSVEIIYNRNFKIMPLLIVATIWYVVVVSVLSIGQHLLERRFARGTRASRGTTASGEPGALARLRQRAASEVGA